MCLLIILLVIELGHEAENNRSRIRQALVSSVQSSVPAFDKNAATNASIFYAEGFQKRVTLAAKFLLELFRAIAITAGPWLGSVFVPAIASRMRVGDLEQIKIFFPVRAFFFQRRVAKTGLHPSRDGRIVDPRLLHVMEIFITRDRTAPKRAFIDRM